MSWAMLKKRRTAFQIGGRSFAKVQLIFKKSIPALSFYLFRSLRSKVVA